MDDATLIESLCLPNACQQRCYLNELVQGFPFLFFFFHYLENEASC